MNCPNCGAPMIDIVFDKNPLWLCPDCGIIEDFEERKSER